MPPVAPVGQRAREMNLAAAGCSVVVAVAVAVVAVVAKSGEQRAGQFTPGAVR